MNKIEQQIIKLLQGAGVLIEDDIKLSIPPKSEMGDFAFSCFDIAKKLNISPNDAANDVSKNITVDDSIVDEVKVFGPYVNFFLNTSKVGKIVIEEIKVKGEKYGHNVHGENKKILIEYPSNNTHKDLHIGHLRNICIGNTLLNLYKANGYNPIAINYINDFGAHVAKCLWGIKKFHNNEEPSGNKQKWLSSVYVEASNAIKDNPEYKKESQELQKQLENKDKDIWELYLKTHKWSMDRFNEIFKELGVKHQKTFFEKDVKDDGQKVVDELLKKDVAKIGEGGAIIVDLSEFNLDIGLLRKSNGVGLYLTADLGLALAKHKFVPDIYESIHLTGIEQNFYFKQLFQILKLAGYNFKTTHIGYALINGPDGKKMSSRDGGVMAYDELFNNIFSAILKETKKRHIDWTDKKIEDTAKSIAFAVIKFDFLKHESTKAINFDPKSAISFDGFTGSYILYAIARINSILRKSKESNVEIENVDYNNLIESEEKQLCILMNNFASVIKKSFTQYNSSSIAKYVFDLAKMYNDFYNKHSVLSADTKEKIIARLELSQSVRDVLKRGLKLLSIDSIDEM